MTEQRDFTDSPTGIDAERLRCMIDGALPLFLLIDPLGGEPLGHIDASQEDVMPQRQRMWERALMPVRLAGTISLPPHQHPYLVRLSGPDDPLLESTLKLAEDERLAAQSGGFDGRGSAVHAIAGWLQSDMPEAEIGAALSKMCRVNTAAATRAKYFRMADRRVLDLLCHIAGEERVAGQLGRIETWTYLDPMGQLRRLRSPHEQSCDLRLSAPEWRRLSRSERLNRTISTWLGVKGTATQSADGCDYDAAEKAVIAAELTAKKWPHRFHSSDDEITWAVLSICHPALPQLTEVHALMAETGSPDDPPEPVRYLYGDLLALLARANGGATPLCDLKRK